jgi:hypothetical protein
MRSLLPNISISQVNDAAAAGTSTINTSILDMQGYYGVLYLAILGDITATCVLALKAQVAATNSGGAMADQTSAITPSWTAGATDTDLKILALDVRPSMRYTRATLTRGTANAVLNSILAIRYGARTSPASLADVIASLAI